VGRNDPDHRPHRDRREIEEVFVRAGGPGAQNVNKGATAVQLRFDPAHARDFHEFGVLRLIRNAREAEE
jgi:ribosome-associated protein